MGAAEGGEGVLRSLSYGEKRGICLGGGGGGRKTCLGIGKFGKY